MPHTSKTRFLRSALVMLLALAACLWAGRIGSMLTLPQINGWYAALEKPFFNPPNIVFPIVWTLLFILMAIAFWRAFMNAPTTRDKNRVLWPFGIQLFLNIGWSWAFFHQQSPLLGLLVIGMLLAAIIWMITAFKRESLLAFWLLVPYLAWVGFAAVLNTAIWWLNR